MSIEQKQSQANGELSRANSNPGSSRNIELQDERSRINNRIAENNKPRVSCRYEHEYTQSSIVGEENEYQSYHIKIEYKKKFQYVTDFWSSLKEDIAFTNNVLQQGKQGDRVRIRQTVEEKFHNDIMFKFKISLFDTQWT